jgi:hypothetical protein
MGMDMDMGMDEMGMGMDDDMAAMDAMDDMGMDDLALDDLVLEELVEVKRDIFVPSFELRHHTKVVATVTTTWVIEVAVGMSCDETASFATFDPEPLKAAMESDLGIVVNSIGVSVVCDDCSDYLTELNGGFESGCPPATPTNNYCDAARLWTTCQGFVEFDTDAPAPTKCTYTFDSYETSLAFYTDLC